MYTIDVYTCVFMYIDTIDVYTYVYMYIHTIDSMYKIHIYTYTLDVYTQCMYRHIYICVCIHTHY